MDILSFIKQERFIALARHVGTDIIADVAKALYAGGIRILEITFDPGDPDTLKNTAGSIRIAAGTGMLIGAGTVLTVDAAVAAYEAGAAFIVSPNTDEKVIAKTKELNMLSIPGAYTPTEIVNAHEIGADIVKIFPVLPHQLDYVKVVSSPLSHINFMVTGGINPGNAADFLKSGAVAVAAGASIIKTELVRNKNWNEISRLAEEHLLAIKKGL